MSKKITKKRVRKLDFIRGYIKDEYYLNGSISKCGFYSVRIEVYFDMRNKDGSPIVMISQYSIDKMAGRIDGALIVNDSDCIECHKVNDMKKLKTLVELFIYD